MNLADLLAPIKEIALKAGALEMRHYADGTDVMRKGDGSPVTIADQEAEALILEEMDKLNLNIPIVAEESVAAGIVPDITGGDFWLVDPLDGTKEFVRGTGEFTVNIALMQNFKPVFGVIYTPVKDELYSGYEGGRADLTIGGERREIQCRDVPDAGLTVVASRSHSNLEALSTFLEGRPVADTVFRGSSLKFCQVASGRADIYPRLAPTCEWDIAAGHAIVRAAGGQVRELDGGEMSYGKTDVNFLNPSFIVQKSQD
tara:strand:+ start:7666 stop:8439 length:774 start_codon:yes stop_codon:yes gene_type:complete